MRPSRGRIGVEFVVSTALFLAAFWYIYIQSALMLAPQLQRADVRETAVELYSSILAADPDEGFAEDGSGANILDTAKLDAVDGLGCADVQSDLMAGAEFAFKVTTEPQEWACSTGIPKEGVVRRLVFVRFAGLAYHPGILEVWAS
jgi:hypothetical protein